MSDALPPAIFDPTKLRRAGSMLLGPRGHVLDESKRPQDWAPCPHPDVYDWYCPCWVCKWCGTVALCDRHGRHSGRCWP